MRTPIGRGSAELLKDARNFLTPMVNDVRDFLSPQRKGTTRSGTTFQRDYEEANLVLPPDIEDMVQQHLMDSMQDGTSGMEDLMDEFEYVFSAIDGKDPEGIDPASYKDIYTNPTKFHEAWNNPDPFQRSKWRAAIVKEFTKMENLKVWRKIKRSEIPPGRRCVKHKWVFEIKRDGTFRARLVACGYSQIPGVDFQEVYSPVINDVTVRILLVMKLVWKLQWTLVDVETAFLHGVLKDEEAVFMDCPAGMVHQQDECLKLEKTIYGLVQSARAYYNKFREVMSKIGFQRSEVDPCLFYKQGEHGVVYVGIWVDDCLFVGHQKAIDDAIGHLKKSFNLKIDPNVKDYLSCEFILDKHGKKAWIGQPHLIKKIEKTFEGKLPDKTFKTPGTPHFPLQKGTEEDGDALLSPEEQTLYRSGTGMLMYLNKYTRPDISNAVRELTKGMQKANKAAFKEMLRVIKFVLQTKGYGLKVDPFMLEKITDQWIVELYTDSDWAGDKETRRSISGFVVFFQGCLICWKSRQQKSVSLSSSESEHYALSEAAKEIKFIAQLLLSMNIPIKLPIICRVDNVGAIFMAENINTTPRSKHIDIRMKFVAEYVEDGFLRIVFVKSEENLSDGYTKNVNEEVYEAHNGAFVAPKEYLDNYKSYTANVEVESFQYEAESLQGSREGVGRNPGYFHGPTVDRQTDDSVRNTRLGKEDKSSGIDHNK